MWWQLNKAHKVVREVFGVTHMMVKFDFTTGKRVILVKSNMMSMSPSGRRSCFSCTAQSDMASFESCDLADHIFLVGPLIELLDQMVCKFTLCQWSTRTPDKTNGTSGLQFVWNTSLLYQTVLSFAHSHLMHVVCR
jgi:hypothetical protein